MIGNSSLGVRSNFLLGERLVGERLVGDMVRGMDITREYLQHCDMVLIGSAIYSETSQTRKF